MHHPRAATDRTGFSPTCTAFLVKFLLVNFFLFDFKGTARRHHIIRIAPALHTATENVDATSSGPMVFRPRDVRTPSKAKGGKGGKGGEWAKKGQRGKGGESVKEEADKKLCLNLVLSESLVSI